MGFLLIVFVWSGAPELFCGFLARERLEHLFAPSQLRLEIGNRLSKLGTLLDHVRKPGAGNCAGLVKLCELLVADVVKVQQLPDILKAEPETFAAQNEF
jgi:hypothetical protein